MADNFLVQSGFDPNSPISPLVPMSSRSATARGPDVSRKIVGAEEAGGIDRINETAAAIDAAKRAEADAIKAQNDLESERRNREAAVLRAQQGDMQKAEADRAANREKKQLAFDAEEKAYTEKHGGSQEFWDHHPVGDKILSGIAIALGGLGMAMAGRPGENPGLEAVNRTIGQWHSDRQKQLEIDRDKLTRSKARIEDVDAWYEKEKLRNEARYKAELAAIAKEFDSQAATLKSPEARAKAEQEAAKFRMEAEKNKQFYLEGQRQTENQAGVTMSATNSAPTADGVSMPGVPKIQRVGAAPAGSTAPVAQRPATPSVDPLAGISGMGRLQMPGEQSAAQLPVGAADMLRLKAPEELGGQRRPKRPTTAGTAPPVAKSPANMMQPQPGANAKKEEIPEVPKPKNMPAGPVFNTDGGITLPGGQKIDSRKVAASGILYGDNGAPIGLIRDKAVAQKLNEYAHAVKDYRNEVLSLYEAAKAVRAAGSDFGKQNDAIRAFQSLQKMTVNKGKIIVGDALSESEKANVLALTWQDLALGTGNSAMNKFIGSIDRKIGSSYSANGVNPREALPLLYGSKPNSGSTQRKVVRTGKNKQGQRVVQYEDGTIEVAE